MKVVPVQFFGGPFDGLAQGWNIQKDLPDELRMSLELATIREGMRLEITSPSASGALLPHERAPDEVLYRKRDEGIYYYDPIGEDFEMVPLGSA